VRPLEIELGMKSSHRIGRFADVSKSKEYHDRIEAHQLSAWPTTTASNRTSNRPSVILVGRQPQLAKRPLRCTWRCNMGPEGRQLPAIPEDFDRQQLPTALVPQPQENPSASPYQTERLAEIRNERRPNSRYCVPSRTAAWKWAKRKP
jgi:regulator of PEP synthase PpsR (kinase-PPPase family)